MSQEPVMIAGVCAFPNPNGVRNIRFVDCNYNTLFYLPNQGNLVITQPDGTQMKRQCFYIDDYHTRIGQQSYHIMEFAEIAWRNGCSYLPEHPRQKDSCDTYALYQLKDIIQSDYFCASYESAKKQIKPSHYHCVYRSNLSPSVPLKEIYKKHSVDHRPRNGSLRPICDSDILLVNQGGKQTAYYVESERFQELPSRFTDQLARQNEPGKAKRKQEPER